MKKKVEKAIAHERADTLCPIARAEDLVGDRWTVLMLRELFIGVRRFDEIQAQTEATPQMVADRLKRLETAGLVARRAYQERPPRYEYVLTEKGEAFYPVILALRAWGERWVKAPGEGLAVQYTHRLCGGPAGLGPLCGTCGEPLARDEMSAQPTSPYAREREERSRRFRDGR